MSLCTLCSLHHGSHVHQMVKSIIMNKLDIRYNGLISWRNYLRGGYQAYFFGNINFEIEVAQQGSYMYQHFGEVSGLRRPTGSEPRPALIWAPGIAIWLFQAPILGRGVAQSRLGAEVPKLHQNVGTCMGLVGQLLSQN